MTNELKETRKSNIITIAKTIKDAAKNKQDISEFDSDIKFGIGLDTLSMAAYLYDAGIRMSALDDITIIVKDGRVNEVYSNNENIAVNLIDFDGLDQDEYTALELEALKARQTQHSIW